MRKGICVPVVETWVDLSDQLNRNRENKKESKMQPKCSVFISGGWGASWGWQNDQSPRRITENSKQLPEEERGPSGSKGHSGRLTGWFGRGGGDLTLREKLGTEELQPVFLWAMRYNSPPKPPWDNLQWSVLKHCSQEIWRGVSAKIYWGLTTSHGLSHLILWIRC